MRNMQVKKGKKERKKNITQPLNHKEDIFDSVNFVAYGSRLGKTIKNRISFSQMKILIKAFCVSPVRVCT